MVKTKRGSKTVKKTTRKTKSTIKTTTKKPKKTKKKTTIVSVVPKKRGRPRKLDKLKSKHKRGRPRKPQPSTPGEEPKKTPPVIPPDTVI